MKIIKYLFYLLLLFLLIVFFDMTKINYKYENKRLVEINSKNINSSFIKSIINFIELRHEDLLLKFSEKSKEYWVVEKKAKEKFFQILK
jgi:hypothetical protein